MIIENNRTKLIDDELQSIAGQMSVLRTRLQELKELRKLPMPWAENSTLRLVLSDAAIMKIWLINPQLVEGIRASDSITAEKDGDTTYVYLSFVNDADKTLILSSGGVIEPNKSKKE